MFEAHGNNARLFPTDLGVEQHIRNGDHLLGEWCKTNIPVSVIDCVAHNTMSNIWDSAEVKHNDAEYLNSLIVHLEEQIGDQLNNIHQLNHDYSYWSLLIGAWLVTFATSVFEKWSELTQFNDAHPSIPMVAFKNCERALVWNNTSDSVKKLAEDSIYNQCLYQEIASLIPNLQLTYLNGNLPEFEKGFETNAIPFHKRIPPLVLNFLSESLGWFRRRENVVFHALHIGKINQTVLLLKLRQLPFFKWSPEKQSIKKFYRECPPIISADKCFKRFGSILAYMVARHIPTIFLEDYQISREIATSWHPSMNPKFIMTSYGHFFDDIFKLYVAEKRLTGSRLIICEHGTGILNKYNFLRNFEERCADNYIPKTCYVKHPNSIVQTKPNDILIVTSNMPRHSIDLRAMPMKSAVPKYMDAVIKLYLSLTPSLRSQTRCRLYPRDYGWRHKDQWHRLAPTIQFSPSNYSYEKDCNSARITIFTCNTSSMVDGLAKNRPAILFWPPNTYDWPEKYNHQFEQLKKVGIFHDTPESVSEFLEHNWKTIEDWWSQNHVQKARKNFLQASYQVVTISPSQHLMQEIQLIEKEQLN